MEQNRVELSNKYLNVLASQISISEIDISPKGAPQKGERVVSVGIPDDLKRLWCYSKHLMADALKLGIDHEMNPAITKADYQKPKYKSEVLSSLFWWALRVEFNIWGHDIGIRENWTVVEFDQDSKDIVNMLKKRLGGSIEDLGDLDLPC